MYSYTLIYIIIFIILFILKKYYILLQLIKRKHIGFSKFLEVSKNFIDNQVEKEIDIEMVETQHQLVGFLSNLREGKMDLMLKYDNTLK
jgi:hypothetical protein